MDRLVQQDPLEQLAQLALLVQQVLPQQFQDRQVQQALLVPLAQLELQAPRALAVPASCQQITVGQVQTHSQLQAAHLYQLPFKTMVLVTHLLSTMWHQIQHRLLLMPLVQSVLVRMHLV
jgi:hypothetical protein